MLGKERPPARRPGFEWRTEPPDALAEGDQRELCKKHIYCTKIIYVEKQLKYTVTQFVC